MKQTRRFVLAGAAALVTSPAVAATRALPGVWTPKAPMPWAAQEIYCTLFKGEVLVAGGLYGVPREDRRFSIGVLDRTALYDPRRDRWREGPRLPTPRHHPSFATVGDRAYAVGGFVTEGKKQWTATAEVLSFDGRGWTPVAPIPEPQNETVALALGGRIHVVTGRSPSHTANGQWGDQRDSAAHQVYDARANRWDDARPAPTARNSAAGAVIGGKLYVVGGRTVQGGNLDVLERYDPKADAWETLRPMPQASGGLAAAALNGRLYAFGGEYFDRNGGGVYEATWEYDPPTDQWRAVAPMRTPRHGLAGIAVNGSIFSIGGAVRASAEGTTAVVEAFTPEGVSAS